MTARPARLLFWCACLAACSGGSRDDSAARAPPGRVADADSVTSYGTFDSVFAATEAIFFSGEYDSALAVLRDVRDRAAREGVVGAEARALTWIGLAHWRLGNYGQARRVGEAALALKQQHALTDQYFRSYNALGLLAWMESRLSDAEQLYRQAIAAAQRTEDRRNEATARGNLALVQTDLGQFREAQAGFEFMQATMAELGEARLEGNALTNLGMLGIRLGDPTGAIPLLHRALARYHGIAYSTGIQNALGQLGTAYAALGDLGQAFGALDSALTLATEQGLRQDEASDLEAMADLYRAAGDFRRALELYDSAKVINAALDGLEIETGIDLRSEADIYVRLGDLDRARTSALEALSIHERAGAPMEVLGDLLILAEILDRLGQEDRTEGFLAEARTVTSELGARVARVDLGLTEARIADRRRRASRVLAAIGRIEPDLDRGGYAAEWEARLLESRALERLGKTEAAAAAGRRGLATVERVRGNFRSGVLRTAFVADKREVYAHLMSVLLRLGRLEEAFEVADAARGRVLLERLPLTTQPGSGAEPAAALSDGEVLLSEIDKLVESIDYLEGTPAAKRSPDESLELARLYERLKRARREYEGLLVVRTETNRHAAAFVGGARTDVRAVRAVLDPQQLLVEYFVPPEGPVVVFLVSRDQVYAIEGAVDGQNLTSRVRLARALMVRERRPSERLDRVLEGLHDALVAPLLRAGVLSGADELVVVPHQVLGYLPWGALRDRTTGRYLIEDFMLRVLPSAAALPVLAERRRSGEAAKAAEAVAFAPFPKTLPATRLEIEAVANRGGRVERFTGARATERAVRRALGGSRLVHLATHGILNAQNPMFSRLELARNGGGDPTDDGRLEVHELLTLPVRAQLVFLSGCETGVGAAHATAFAGEDYATLAQAFLYAGAGSVVATLWPVEDAGAAAFAEQFYRHLQDEPPALALARAQRAMLADERWGAAYFWAGYQLAGNNGHGAHRESRTSVSSGKR